MGDRSKPDQYRIREARVQVANGYTLRVERMFCAERMVSFLFIRFFWPVDGGWRRTPQEAEHDAARDRMIRAPLSKPTPIFFDEDLDGKGDA